MGGRAIPWRLLGVAAAGATAMTAAFAVAETIGPAWLLDPGGWQRGASVGVALATIALLAGDVVLPVPSSVVVMASGAVFGLTLGAVIAGTGLLAGTALGYAIGRSARPWATRMLGDADAAFLASAVAHRGAVAVAATRPLPIVAELTAIAAGTARLPLVRFVVGAGAGSAVTATCFAAVGASGASSSGVVPAVAAAAMWLVGSSIVTIHGTSAPWRARRA